MELLRRQNDAGARWDEELWERHCSVGVNTGRLLSTSSLKHEETIEYEKPIAGLQHFTIPPATYSTTLHSQNTTSLTLTTSTTQP